MDGENGGMYNQTRKHKDDSKYKCQNLFHNISSYWYVPMIENVYAAYYAEQESGFYAGMAAALSTNTA